jgi:hypothetical protein
MAMLRFVAESQDGSDVIGTLTIGRSSPMDVESAYLDSWLAGILDCVVAASQGVEHHEVDLVEESTPLIGNARDGELSLRFGDQMAELGPLDLAINEIVADVRQLLQRYPLRNDVLAHEIESRLGSLTRA